MEIELSKLLDLMTKKADDLTAYQLGYNSALEEVRALIKKGENTKNGD